MTEEFRAAFQRVLDTAASQDPDFSPAVHEVFRLSSGVPREELSHALEALAPVLSSCERATGIAADLSVLAGSLVESGAPAGQVGLEVLRQLGGYGQAAMAFARAWETTGGGPVPAPHEVTEAEERRVADALVENAPSATLGWWASQRYGLAAKAVLGDTEVRAAVRGDADALAGLGRIADALSAHMKVFTDVGELLRMAETDRLLVLDRASWRGFRVRFDGVGDNFQLHTLLADALIGKEGRDLPGTRPDPRWAAACLNAAADPLADVVRGEWDLVGGDGTWIGNEALPRDIPVVDGERVLVLEAQSLAHTWRAGRKHPHIPGFLEVVEELPGDEAAAWWARVHPAGSVRHPMAPPLEHGDTGSHMRPGHFGVAAHFAEVDSGPLSARREAPQTLAEPDPLSWPPEPRTADPFPWPPGPDSASGSPEPDPLPWTPEAEPAPRASEPGREHEPFSWTPDPAPAPSPPEPDPLPWTPEAEPPRQAAEPAPDPLADFRSPGPVADAPEPFSRTPEPDRAPAPEPSDEDGPPGARLLPPMPPGVSTSHRWAPSWRWPTPPRD
ncbi:hypothetical protein [Nocardiopsis sp. CNT312]|uniref:hypothetical protein n=1 Tax=Nocardiopsis sp. CNT312 TaxID=1137268 RepID=UPI00048CAEEF|nr:hypothetical protein [Nocardiopsis sp. CNT312]